jgi:hypothetical protein
MCAGDACYYCDGTEADHALGVLLKRIVVLEKELADRNEVCIAVIAEGTVPLADAAIVGGKVPGDEPLRVVRRLVVALAAERKKLAWMEGVRLPHARKQENANGFQRGWHAALSRVGEGDAVGDLAALVPQPAVEVEVPVYEADAALAALCQELKVAEGFHDVAVKERNAAWNELTALRQRRAEAVEAVWDEAWGRGREYERDKKPTLTAGAARKLAWLASEAKARLTWATRR